jgi:uncharacterized protein (DUF934 family)
MRKLIKYRRADPSANSMDWGEDPFVHVADDQPLGSDTRDLIVSFRRFQSEGAAWLADRRKVGVRLKPDEPVEQLADVLPHLAVIALEFPTFRDGRGYSTAASLRDSYGYTGEIRAVGEVLRDQAFCLIRCGFDAFEPSDGSRLDAWARSAFRFRHVYQAAEDQRFPARKTFEHVEAPETSE